MDSNATNWDGAQKQELLCEKFHESFPKRKYLVQLHVCNNKTETANRSLQVMILYTLFRNWLEQKA